MTEKTSLEQEYKRTQDIFNGFMKWIMFYKMDEGRNPNFYKNHLFSVLNQDYIESIFATPILVKEGILNPTIRESRYILEMSIKIAFIQQKDYSLSIEEKLEKYKKKINTSKISHFKELNLSMLKNESQKNFLEDCGRFYGQSSDYIHLTTKQFDSRKKAVDNGLHIGFETLEMLTELNDFLEKIYSLSIVLMMHSIPEYISGDWLVESNGKTIDWIFTKSKYIAEIDSFLTINTSASIS